MRLSHVALSLVAFAAPMIAHAQQLPANPQIQVFENPAGRGGSVRLQRNPERVELNRTALARLHSTLVRHSIVVGFTNSACGDLALERCMEALSELNAVNRAVPAVLPLDSWNQTVVEIDKALAELARAEKDQARLIKLKVDAISARATIKKTQEVIDNNPDPGVPKEISSLSEKHGVLKLEILHQIIFATDKILYSAVAIDRSSEAPARHRAVHQLPVTALIDLEADLNKKISEAMAEFAKTLPTKIPLKQNPPQPR